MKRRQFLIGKIVAVLACLGFQGSINPGFTAIPAQGPQLPADSWNYADIADLFARAPIIVRMRITAATALKSPPNPQKSVRFYVEGDVVALLRGAQAMPPKLIWLVDMQPDSRGKIAKLKKAEVLIAAFPVPDRPGEIRLAARDAQVLWSPAIEARVRAIIASVAAPDAVPAITGIGSAFHTAGTISGEGETQIFVPTVSGAPVSLSILTRPGQPKRWAYAIGDIVDEAAAPPAPDTLAWYRLACFLPRALPDSALLELPATDADAARSDYAFVIQALGACPRVRR